MEEKLVRDELVTLFLAGHETTATALTWTCYLLSQHPQVEAKLQAELDLVLDGRPPVLADLKQLPYTNLIIKEAMRLYPPAPGVARQPIEDVDIGGYILPKGTDVSIMSYLVHHDSRWFEQPEAFIPERFTEENSRQRPKFAYLPFGGGPRICIGNAFAMMEAQLILATIMQQYQLRLAPEQKVGIMPQITLKPKYGMKMIIHKRDTLTSTLFKANGTKKRQPTAVPS